jgi:uncharacterized protein YijF (DUF1287 family)
MFSIKFITGCCIVIVAAYSSASLADEFVDGMVAAAIERTNHHVTYDGAYRRLDYPGGDVPQDTGVCTDVLVRSYRAVGIDLQVKVHEDMAANFDAYPSKRIWGLSQTDKSIDHRRVPNLQTFFSRQGQKPPITSNATDYLPGDIVTWMLPGNLPHIGIVTDRLDLVSGQPLLVHNIGAGPKLEDILFSYKITGHYRYVP